MGKQIEMLDEGFSTTRLCYKLIGNEYLDENGRIKEEYKFKINNPKFKIQNSKLIGKPEDKFETMLFLPEGEGRKGEGGLRTKGYFKFNYKLRILDDELEKKQKIQNPKSKIQNYLSEWWIVDNDNNPIEKVKFPDNILKQLTNNQLTSTNNKLTTPNNQPTTFNPKLELNYLPLITVITVVYNGEKYLKETIKSVINQTYPNVEYIIIDGGSTDGTLNIIKRYEDKIDYWVSEKDKGIYDAMNKGLILSMGKYIGILNSDDMYVQDSIEVSIKTILKNGVDYSFGSVKYKDGDVIKPISPLKKGYIYQEMPYPHISAFISRKVYKEVGLFDATLKIAGDHDMALKIHLNGHKYFCIDKIIGILSKGGISESFAGNMESFKVAVKNGKDFHKALFDLMVQFIKLNLVKILPKWLVLKIQKIKRSRFYSNEV